jgi:hypothetical protein
MWDKPRNTNSSLKSCFGKEETPLVSSVTFVLQAFASKPFN